MTAESPRKCKICGGPNHYGCGCEARQKQAAVQVETENIKPAEQPVSETPTPVDEIDLDDILSPEAIRAAHETNLKMAKDTARLADGVETLCTQIFDSNNYLKLLAGDLITIRNIVLRNEVKNADPDGPEKNKN